MSASFAAVITDIRLESRDGDRYRWQVVVITTTTGEWYVRMISPAPLGGSSEQAMPTAPEPTAPDRDRTAGRR